MSAFLTDKIIYFCNYKLYNIQLCLTDWKKCIIGSTFRRYINDLMQEDTRKCILPKISLSLFMEHGFIHVATPKISRQLPPKFPGMKWSLITLSEMEVPLN